MKKNILFFVTALYLGIMTSLSADITKDLDILLQGQEWGKLANLVRTSLKDHNADTLAWMHSHQSLLVVNNEFCLYYLDKYNCPGVEFTHEDYSHLLECMLMFYIRVEQDVACCNTMGIKEKIDALNQLSPKNTQLLASKELLGFKDITRRSTIVQQKFFCRWFSFFEELARDRGVPKYETILNRLKERYGIPLGDRKQINKPFDQSKLKSFPYLETPATVLYCSLTQRNEYYWAGKVFRLSFCFNQAEPSVINFFAGNAIQQEEVANLRVENAKNAFFFLSGYKDWLGFWGAAMKETDEVLYNEYMSSGLLDKSCEDKSTQPNKTWLEYDSDQGEDDRRY